MSSVAKLPHTLSAQLRVASGGDNSLCEVALQQFTRSYELASWRSFEWLQGEVWMILASQARLSLWAHVMLSASILDLLRSV